MSLFSNASTRSPYDSGKIMAPVPLTPSVAAIRDHIYEDTGERFDCALLNLYPDGSSACKWHTDPDLGRLWARDSVIVSVGETRRFAFREIGGSTDPNLTATSGGGAKGKGKGAGGNGGDVMHWWRVRNGDCVWMFADCNDTWEHAVLKAEGDCNDGPRARIVFKRSVASKGGRRGHGLAGEGRQTRAAQKQRQHAGRGSSGGSKGGKGGAGREPGQDSRHQVCHWDLPRGARHRQESPFPTSSKAS